MKTIKQLSISEIIQRRKESLRSCKRSGTAVDEMQPAVVPQMHTHVDRIVRAAQLKEKMSQEICNSILAVISAKSGVTLNADIFADHFTLLYCPAVLELERFTGRIQQNYFVVSGSLLVFAQHLKSKAGSKGARHARHHDDPFEKEFITVTDFQKQHIQYQLVEEIGVFQGLGSCLRPNKETKERDQAKHKLVAVDAVLVRFKTPSHYAYSDGISSNDKLSLLEGFAILKTLGKRLNWFANDFKLRHFPRNHAIYQAGEHATCVCFTVSGQICLLSAGVTDSAPNIETQILTDGSYFGEEQILLETPRQQTAKCISAQCSLLELPRQIFLKLIESSDFQSAVTQAARDRGERRDDIIRNIRSIKTRMNDGNNQQIGLDRQGAVDGKASVDSKARKSKKTSVLIMHGNIIKRPQVMIPADEDSSFSMLQANPDMFQATLKKFRRYNLKKREKYVPDINWDLRRVWKVLHLEDLLREDTEVHSPEGRKFYDCHRRYLNQLTETKSMRPKSTSSTYRNKLQYIAYLQNFNA